MKKKIILFTFLSVFLCVLSITLHFESVAITFGTFSYHFIMRLAVGYVIDGIYHNRMDYKNSWFKEKPFESVLYKKLKVKHWKKHMPTYAPETFAAEKHSAAEIVSAMCQAEIVHEVISILSFIPIAFSIKWGAFWVFLITSLAAAAYDMSFVIMQRYNRPRLIRIMEKHNERRTKI